MARDINYSVCKFIRYVNFVPYSLMGRGFLLKGNVETMDVEIGKSYHIKNELNAQTAEHNAQ